MESVKNGLIEEINLNLDGLKQMEIGGEEYTKTVDGVGKMADRIIKIQELEHERIVNEQKLEHERIVNEQKLEHERIVNEQKLENERIVNEQKLEHERKDQKMKNGIAIGTAAASLLAYFIAFAISRNDEREGYIQTTEGGRGALKNLLTLKFRK